MPLPLTEPRSGTPTEIEIVKLLLRLRAPLIGVVALAFSTSVALGAAPTTPGAGGLANAASHAGKTVPVRAVDEQVEETVTETGTETSETTAETTTETSGTGSADNCNVDLTQDPSVLATLNHGSVVCSAAHQDPPDGYSADGFRNHGAWVSSFAKGDHGSNHSSNAMTHQPSR
jgi:hypothetical protein